MRVRRRVPSDDRKANPQLQYFIDCLRACLDKDPLYDRRYIPDIERFNLHPRRLPAAPARAPVY